MRPPGKDLTCHTRNNKVILSFKNCETVLYCELSKVQKHQIEEINNSDIFVFPSQKFCLFSFLWNKEKKRKEGKERRIKQRNRKKPQYFQC